MKGGSLNPESVFS